MEAMAPHEMDQDHRQKSVWEELEKKVQDQIEAKEQEIGELRVEIRELRVEIRGLRAEKEKMGEDIREVEQKIAIASGAEEIEPLKATLQFLRQETTSFSQQISSFSQQITNRDQQISSIRQELSSLRPVREAPASAGGERPLKRLKASGIGFSESVDKVVKDWKSKHSKFLGKSKETRCELSTENGVPLDHRGHRSILLDRLTDGWTKDVPSLWERANSDEIVPVIGVSGSGKSRFLYELLAEKWGFFWTARTKGNGGSEDFRYVIDYEIVQDNAANHRNVMKRMRCAILARLLILEIFLDEIPDLKPLQWLMLQVQFRVFSSADGTNADVYLALTTALMDTVLEDSDGLDRMTGELWEKLQSRLNCTFIVILDEAQVLGSIGVDCYESPDSGSLRPIFSPLVRTLHWPSTRLARGPVFVAGTGVSFLKLEREIGSSIAKSSVKGSSPFVSAPFSSWRDVDQVLEFCRLYLKLEDGQEEDNARYLLRKFRGRRRCLVSCIERLLDVNKGEWSEEVVDDYFNEITSSSSSSREDLTSIYYAVEVLCKSKGHFYLNNVLHDGNALVRRLGLLLAFDMEGQQFLVSTKEDMTLLEVGLGQLKHSSGPERTFSIYEPTVHWSILNYLTTTVTLEVLLREQMAGCMRDASAVGRLWEYLFTFYVPKLFDGTKLLAEMCCFKGAKLATLPQNFAIDRPVITGELNGAWRESYTNTDKTVSAFLDADEKRRQPCFIFNDRSGPDVLFVVRLGDLKIPVFCQLKLRSRVDWYNAEATTNPELMYIDLKHATFRKRVLDACKDGCISLVVCYPVKKPAKVVSGTQNSRLLGYIGRTEAETLFDSGLCGFLKSLVDLRQESL